MGAGLGPAGAPLTRFPDGSQPVYAVGDEHVLKLFPGAAARDGMAYVNGWRYVPMSRLSGENLADVWDRVPRADRERIVAEIGEAPGSAPGPLSSSVDRGLSAAWLEQIP